MGRTSIGFVTSPNACLALSQTNPHTTKEPATSSAFVGLHRIACETLAGIIQTVPVGRIALQRLGEPAALHGPDRFEHLGALQSRSTPGRTTQRAKQPRWLLDRKSTRLN